MARQSRTEVVRRDPSEAVASRNGHSRPVRAFAARIVTVAGRRYVAGPQLADAVAVADELRRREGLATLVGYWDHHEAPEVVERHYADAVDALAGRPDAEVAIKPPALGDDGRLRALAERAAAAGVRLHCDALRLAQADAGLRVPEQLARDGGPPVGVTLPGRWRRSLDDAERLRELPVHVRVVKGQWPDPDDPDRDPAAGVRAVVHRLAGGVATVAVATHDGLLAADALATLQAAGTAAELQLLYGLPALPALVAARALRVAVRAYVPYGSAYLPYALSQLRHRPAMAAWLLRDLVGRRRGWAVD